MRVLVTAGAAGIGLAMAGAFAARGDQVRVCDIDPKAVANLSADHPNITATLADVSDPDQVDSLFHDIRSDFGGLDVLVNNAGVAGPTAPVEDIRFDDWKKTLAVNCDGSFLCTRAAVPLLKQAGGGSIVNMSSTAGIMGYPLRTPYACAKWAIIGLTKTWAMELGEFNIRVNAICPGAVTGPRMDHVISMQASASGRMEDDVREGFARQVSLRKFVTVEDIANTVLFLCSAAGDSISGQALGIDGHTETLRSH